MSFKNYHSREYYKNKKIKIITWVHASSQSNIRVAEIANKLPNAYLNCFSEQYGAILDAAKYIVNALATPIILPVLKCTCPAFIRMPVCGFLEFRSTINPVMISDAAILNKP